MALRIIILSDGAFGDRAAEIVARRFPDTSMVLVEPRDAREIIDEYEFPPGVRDRLRACDLIISYIRHPDINLDLASIGKPLIFAIDLGRGFLQQARDINPAVHMPSTMCHLEATTGIDAIDDFAEAFGLPRYELAFDSTGARIERIRTTVESPCGATRRSIHLLKGAAITPETLNAFAINIAQECRESVAYMMAKSDSADRATWNHLFPLLDELQRLRPALFEAGGVLHEYTAELQAKHEKQDEGNATRKLLKR